MAVFSETPFTLVIWSWPPPIFLDNVTKYDVFFFLKASPIEQIDSFF